MLTWDQSDPSSPALLDDNTPELPRAHQALLDYLRLGPGRTLPELLQRYHHLQTAPTHSQGTLRNWSSKFAWPARAARFDAIQDERTQAEERARRAAILQRGLALQHERIEHLVAMFEKLASIANTEEAFWVRNIKTIHLENDRVERIEVRRFNGAIIRHMRGLLDDIANETGGRLNHLIPPDPLENPAIHLDDYSLEVLSPAERAEFIRLQNKIFSSRPDPLP